MSQYVDVNLKNNEILVDELFALHLKVLNRLVQGNKFEEIRNDFSVDFQKTDYLFRLTSSGLLSFNDEDHLIAAYPISPTKTKFQLDIEGIGKNYAMCAIDALGVAYTFNAKTTIHTKDAAGKKEIIISVDPNAENILDENVVVTYTRYFKGRSAAEAQCPLINFYVSKDDVPNDLEVEILSLQEALIRGKEVFSPNGFKVRIGLGKDSPMNNCCSVKSKKFR